MKVSELRWVNDPPFVWERRKSQKLKWGTLLIRIIYRHDGPYAGTYSYRSAGEYVAKVFTKWSVLELAAHLIEMEPVDATD